MGLDAGRVLKRSVLCTHCNEEYLFTLRAIANNPELRCYGCGDSIRLLDSIYEPLVSDVKSSLEAIDAAPPTFISARPQTRHLVVHSAKIWAPFVLFPRSGRNR